MIQLAAIEVNATARPDVWIDGNADAPLIFIFTDHFNATYVISLEQPLRALHAMGKVNFGAADQRNVKAAGSRPWTIWLESVLPDIVVMSRYALPRGVELVEECRRLGIPVIYNIDDDLLNLPNSLDPGLLNEHGTARVLEARTRMLEACDLVYASTRELASALGCQLPPQKIVHGEIYGSYQERVPATRAAGPVIGYMGSRGHQDDLERVATAIERVLEQRPGLRFEVFGSVQMPARLKRFGDRVGARQPCSGYAEFLDRLAAIGWSIGLAPLDDVPFNRCKTPTKFVEYTSAGIPCIASRFPVYGHVIPPGAGQLVDPGEWEAAILRWVDDPESSREAVRNARLFCAEAFSTQRLAMQVDKLFGAVRFQPDLIRIFATASVLPLKVFRFSARRHTTARLRFVTRHNECNYAPCLSMHGEALILADIGELRSWPVDLPLPAAWSRQQPDSGPGRLIDFSSPGRQPWIFARNKFGYLWVAEVRRMIDARALSWRELLEVIESGNARPSLLRDVKWSSKLNRPLRWIAGWINTVADRLQGFSARHASNLAMGRHD